MKLQITPIKALRDNYIWLLHNPENGLAVCVDPGDAAPVLTTLAHQQLQLTAILVTHHHWDHIDGINELLSHYPAKVYGSCLETIPHITHTLSEGDDVVIEECNLQLKVLDIPGHTQGHIAYYNEEIVFTGDTLFSSGCGRLFEGTAQQMYDSLTKLSSLDDDVLIYCGHEYTVNNLLFAQCVEPNNPDIKQRLQQAQQLQQDGKATVPNPIGNEKLTNPFLRCQQAEVILAAEHYAGKSLAQPSEVLATIRQWKDKFIAPIG